MSAPVDVTKQGNRYLSPEQVCEFLPGMTAKKLENLRGAGRGPAYFKPTLKTVLYRESDVRQWVEASMVQTRAVAP